MTPTDRDITISVFYIAVILIVLISSASVLMRWFGA